MGDAMSVEWRVEATPEGPGSGDALASFANGLRRQLDRELKVSTTDTAVFVYVDSEGGAGSVAKIVEGAAVSARVPMTIAVRCWSAAHEEWIDPAEWRAADPSVAPANSSSLEAAVLVSTTFEIPGFRAVAFHGEVFGLIVRSRNMVSNLGASAKAVVGGELRGLTRLMSDSRTEALARLRQGALDRGANAVVGLRYDTCEIGDSANEVVAYGTAVTVQRDEPPA
jgi:uncharacterized protein YbjQ (UPF0145 family)